MNVNHIFNYKQLLIFLVLIILSCSKVYSQRIPTAQNKDTVEILSKFGVKGDARSDDSDAIQRAIDYCENNSIKTLYIPNGNYYIKKSVIFNRGGVQLVGTGALLREESWLFQQKQFSDNQPFSGCSFIVDKNVEGFVFSKTVADPIRIRDIQFVAKEGRKPGNTTAIAFKSEFWGPTWPFILERCHFRGFNYAVKFQSPNQYCVAFVQIRNCAFSQNDECIYFSDVSTIKSNTVGIRNLSWGFIFTNNKCHDNSRVIRACFAKDRVNISDNNMEGNITYANGKKPENIIDIELSHATVNFEGNHFESIISNAVYISSVFKDSKGNYLSMGVTTALDERNKVFLRGNNFDGIASDKYKPFILKGLVVYNYDPYKVFVDGCDVRINTSNTLNLFLTNFASENGTNFKLPTGKYENSYLSIPAYTQKKSVTISTKDKPQVLLSPLCNLSFVQANNSVIQFFNTYTETLEVSNSANFIGASFIVNNQTGSDFLGISVIFDVTYTVNGKLTGKTLYTNGNYGTDIGFTTITAILPLSQIPKNAKNINFKATLEVGENILGNNLVFIASRFTLFTFSGNAPYALPVFV